MKASSPRPTQPCRSTRPTRRWSRGSTATSAGWSRHSTQLDLSRETLIVFTSDHGATFESGNQGTSAALDSNRPFRGQKRTLWEGGIRVPAFAYWPGRIAPGVVAPEPMQLTDLLPTFVAAAGGQCRSRVACRRRQPAARAGPAMRRLAERTLFWEWRSEGSDQLAALRGRFKLVVTHGGKPELYDVVSDPAERRDISAEHPELTRQLRAELDAWLKTETRR